MAAVWSMMVEVVLTKNGAVRFKGSSGKFVKRPKGLTVNKESFTQNVGTLESEARISGTSRLGLLKKTVDVNDIRELFQRDELLFASIERLRRDIFGKWATITALKENGKVNEKATKNARRIIKRVHYKQRLSIAFRSRMIHGYSIIGLGFPGSVQQKVKNKRLDYVTHIPWDNIRKLRVDLRPGSDNYGEVVGVEYSRAIGTSKGEQSSREDVVIHRDRFQHWVFPDLDGISPEGMSPLMPVYDIISVKKNIDWALGETIWKYAAGQFVAILPGSATDTQYDDFEKKFKDFSAATTFVARGEGFEIQEFGSKKTGLDPSPYTRYFMSLASIGLGVPYSMLFTNLTGGVSDALQRTYASDISDIQRTDVEPLLLDFLGRLGLGEVAEWKIEWKPIMELTEEEHSFIRSRFGLARSLESKAVETYTLSGLSIKLNENGWIQSVFNDKGDDKFILHPKKPDPPPAAPVVPPGQPPGAPAPAQEPPAANLRDLGMEKAILSDLLKEIVGDALAKAKAEAA